jgi:thiol:disulfide interchange protein
LCDEGVKKALSPFARVKIDGSDRSDPKPSAHFRERGIRGLPTLIFLNGEGVEVSRLEGPQRADAIIAAAMKANSGG